MMSTIWLAIFWFTRMCGPMTLTLFPPLMPESASSTLSEIICENPNTTPGNAPCSSSETCSVSFSLVSPRGHSPNGFSGAKSSMLKKPETSVPSSGRPSCETTVVTSGCLRMISRICPT